LQGCPFCKESAEKIAQSQTAFSVFDNYPVTKHHALVIPKRHVGSFFELTAPEYRECISLLHQTRQRLRELDPTITAFNMGVNDGKDAGQTIPHCHIHLIPRRRNDVDAPMGGIRHVFPDRGYYEQDPKADQAGS